MAMTKQSEYVKTYFQVPSVDLKYFELDKDALNLVGEDIIRRSKILPLYKVGKVLHIGMVDPTDILAISEIERLTGCKVEPFSINPTEFIETINKIFNKNNVETKLIKDDFTEIVKDENKTEEDISIIKLVNSIIEEAINNRASDIHLESFSDKLKVRFRIDGKLRKMHLFQKELSSLIISRIKVMCNMDISERRLPQDGHMEFPYESRKIDLRVSTYPTITGEKVVIRILDKGNLQIGLEMLGLSKETLEKVRNVIKKPHGIIFICGPTGSGKTTTLYSILNELGNEEKNIMTIEDPVEYEIKGIIQSQVNLKAGFSFARGLRAILRQDPDIIMVGEVRDKETAEIAISAALTGHLVLTTLHTNDATTCFGRLIDMGIPPYLISTSVIAVISQRLVRKICADCKFKFHLSPEHLPTLERFNKIVDIGSLTSKFFFKGKGCENCGMTGYKGRIGIFEVLIKTEKLKNAIHSRENDNVIREIALEEGMVSLEKDALNKVFEGITTFDEILQVF